MEQYPYEENLTRSIDLITQGINILKNWNDLYTSTKKKIEEDA